MKHVRWCCWMGAFLATRRGGNPLPRMPYMILSTEGLGHPQIQGSGGHWYVVNTKRKKQRSGYYTQYTSFLCFLSCTAYLYRCNLLATDLESGASVPILDRYHVRIRLGSG